MKMRFITPTSLNTKPNSIQIKWKLWEMIGTEVFASLHSCDLEPQPKSLRLHQNIQFNSIYHTNFEPIQYINVWVHANISFQTQLVKQQLYPLFH